MTSTKIQSGNLDKSFTWPRYLRTPQELIDALRSRIELKILKYPLASKLTLQFIGGWSFVLAHYLNTSKIYNFDVFKEELKRIEVINATKNGSQDAYKSIQNSRKGPLLTLSNHISCIDDPILWASLFPFNYYFAKTDTVRWSAAALDICFTKRWHSAFFSFGKTFPLVRGAGLEQPAMDFALALLHHNEWLHLFPEGRVMRDDNQQVISNVDRGYTFKWGMSKLILDYFFRPLASIETNRTESEIRILPFYHLGMDKILPIGWPYIPRTGKQITIYIRPTPINMNLHLLQTILKSRTLSTLKSCTDDEIKRIKLTNFLEEEMGKLIEQANKVHLNT